MRPAGGWHGAVAYRDLLKFHSNRQTFELSSAAAGWL